MNYSIYDRRTGSWISDTATGTSPEEALASFVNSDKNRVPHLASSPDHQFYVVPGKDYIVAADTPGPNQAKVLRVEPVTNPSFRVVERGA